MRRRDIPGIVDDELVRTAVREWQRWKRFGFPHGKGWMQERPIYVRCIEICEQEFDLWQSQEMKKHHGRQ